MLMVVDEGALRLGLCCYGSREAEPSSATARVRAPPRCFCCARRALTLASVLCPDGMGQIAPPAGGDERRGPRAVRRR